MGFLTLLAKTVGRAVLTLFIFGQLIFLFWSNFLEIGSPMVDLSQQIPWLGEYVPNWSAPDEWAPNHPRIQKKLVRLKTKMAWWEDFSGQPQRWGLFAPNVAEFVPFAAVEFRWTNGPDGKPLHRPVHWISDNEPPDRRRFFRFGNFRLRKTESRLDIQPTNFREFNPRSEVWREDLVDYTKKSKDKARIKAYLKWKFERFCRENPELPTPSQVVLLSRFTYIPKPPGPTPWDWTDLGEHQLARWLPDHEDDLEVYNPVSGKFEDLK
jgi:hypothetical protein